MVLSENVRLRMTDAVIEDFSKLRADFYGRYASVSPEQYDILRGIIAGALRNIRFGRDVQATADAAEFIAMELLRGLEIDGRTVNFADAVYWPIKSWALAMEEQFA